MTILGNLNPRERFLMLFALPVMMAAALFNYVWAPVSAQRAATQVEIAGYRMIVETEARTRDIGQMAPVAATPDGPIAPRVTRSAQAHGLTLSRLEPDADLLRVSVETARFGDVIDWIATMETTQGIRLTAIEIDRRPEPGTVAARLTLEPAS